MLELTPKLIRTQVADSPIIYQRGVNIYEHGAFALREANRENGLFTYDIDGNYGDYVTQIQISEDRLATSCDCPYPGDGCKHTVAALLDTRDIIEQWRQAAVTGPDSAAEDEYLTSEEIRQRALEDRENRADNEDYKVTLGDTYKGEHLLETTRGRQYTVTLHDPAAGQGHCSCPDYLTNRLGTCKHLIFLSNLVKKKRGFKTRVSREKFPFMDIYWDSVDDRPRLFSELPQTRLREARKILSDYFDAEGRFCASSLAGMATLLARLNHNKQVRIQSAVLRRVEAHLQDRQIEELAQNHEAPLPENLNVRLYPYQEEGVRFGIFKKAVLIGDEMGLGKTLQAIVLALLKREIFDFQKVLVITPASLKEQWKREIERFTDATAMVIEGTARQRRHQYLNDPAFFKITNYEAVLRDTTVFPRYKPDLIILDEAQRIKNFSTKTADAVKRIMRKHAMVLTGTPLENKLEDVYSIVQFLDPRQLSPLWRFAADHFMLSRRKKNQILGYHNLHQLHEKLKPVVIRRKKEEVLSELPDQIVNDYYVDLHEEQHKIHAGYAQALMPLLNKKYLTPMDVRRIQELLLKMRMVCDSTYLIDRKTHISPKLKELKGIIQELVIESNRKMVIFSEWTTMTFLIARHLSDAGIPFVELSGKIPVKKRQALIDEFTNNPDCKVFLSTDAGGTGLNLQAADCVVNFELPWNPARMNQRIGRVNRIGQQSRCINVVNLVAKLSIEERIYAGIKLKTDLFEGVFEGGMDKVEFSREKRTEMLNRLRQMMGEMIEPVSPEPSDSEEIPEDTPHYLNPKVLKEKETPLDVTAEEEEHSVSGDGVSQDEATAAEREGGAFSWADQAPEKVETVLNSGMQFIGGLLEMATGQKMQASEADDKMVHIDKSTGEVTLKFKLPGF